MTRILSFLLVTVLALPVFSHGAESFNFGPGTRKILEDATPASISNSTVETTLASLTIPANSIAVNGSMEIYLWIRYTNNSLTAATNPLIKVKLGGVQIGQLSKVSGVSAVSALVYGYYCHIWLKNLNVANAQTVIGWNVLTDPTRQLTAQFPDKIDAANLFSTAIDTSVSNLLTVTAQNDFADPAYTTFYDGILVK